MAHLRPSSLVLRLPLLPLLPNHRQSLEQDSITATNDFTRIEELSLRQTTASFTAGGDPDKGIYFTPGRLIFFIKSGRRQAPSPEATRPKTVCTEPASCSILGLNPAEWHKLIKASRTTGSDDRVFAMKGSWASSLIFSVLRPARACFLGSTTIKGACVSGCDASMVS